ncbi:hypothetical protein FEP90_05409 [Burkholderia multivorans]|nr:hypothetical protein [Burkholderia multivorans]
MTSTPRPTCWFVAPFTYVLVPPTIAPIENVSCVCFT